MAHIGLQSTDAAKGTRRSTGLKPKSSPIASQAPKIVCERRGRATWFSCSDIIQTPWRNFWQLLSKRRAKLKNADNPTSCADPVKPGWDAAPRLQADSWEFAPRAASAILQRNIDIRRTDANLVEARRAGP